jgi:hypothetical protein
MAVFCVHLVLDQPQTGASGVVSGQAAWTVYQVQNYNPAGSLSSSQPCWASPLAFGLFVYNSMETGVKINKRLPSLRSANLLDQIFQVI